MTDFEKFQDEVESSSDSSKKKSNKKGDTKNDHSKGGDHTDSKFFIPNEPIEYADEFRNERLDYNFRRNPFLSWLKMMFPHFKLLSISVIYVVVLLIIYGIEWILYVNNRWSCVTYAMGSNYIPAIKRGHVQRLIIPSFLHNDLPHLLWNCFVLLAVGSNAEYYLGTIGYGGLIGAAILLGNTFTGAFRWQTCSQSVGASPVISGILAFEIIWAIFNFRKMGLSKWLYLMYFGTIFVYGYLFDFWGYFAGFIAGICIT